MAVTTSRRRAFSTVLALLLAIESVSAVAAAGVVAKTRTPQPAERTDAAAFASPPTRTLPAPGPESHVVARPPTPVDLDADRRPVAVTVPEAPTGSVTGERTAPGPGQLAAPAIKLDAPAADSATKSTATGTTLSVATYTGRNHVWIPALGLSKSVSSFACSRSREPDNHVYRWGCAGSDNVYLLGHAWGVFKPLHDAYTKGRLKVGMKVVYADGNGRVRTYAVRWWKVVKPTTAASWAWASQATPSMTLQTCVGAQSQNRLMVRLTEAG